MSESCPPVFQQGDSGRAPVPGEANFLGAGLEGYSEDIHSDSGIQTPKEEKIQRDDLKNPSWIEDPEVLNGPISYLKDDETEFWKGKFVSQLSF